MSKVIGIDLGADAVKVAQMEVTFRSASLVSVSTLEVEPGPEALLERSIAALSALDAPEPTDSIVVGIPGDQLLIRQLSIPFSDARKVAPIIGGELADDIPWPLEEVVYDFVIPSGNLGSVVAAAIRRDVLGGLLQQLQALGLSPRHVAVAPLAYAHLTRQLGHQGPVAVVDLGHLRTNVCTAIEGRPVAVRTISQGGHQLTQCIRGVLQLSYADAQQYKEQQAFLTADWSQMAAAEHQTAETTARAFAVLNRELRRTLEQHAASIGSPHERLLVCGGTSLLRGLPEYLSEQFEVPVERLRLAAEPEFAEAGIESEGEAVAALALALSHGRRPEIELRQGPYAFKIDRSVFRDKIFTVAASVLAVLFFAALSAYASLRSLRQDQESLETRLGRETMRVFGKKMLNPRRVSRTLRKKNTAASAAVPERTAVDVMTYIAERLPRSDKVQIEISRLDIKSKKTYLKGTANSQSSVGKLVSALKEVDCFSEVSSGKISTDADGKKTFSITMTTGCF